MRKSIKVLLSLVLIMTLSTTLSASSLIRDITGKENKGITVKYNNQVQNLKDGNGNPVYPVIINGSTYLPVRAIADMLGADITWEGKTKTIYITGNGANKNVDNAVPTDLPSTTNNNSNSSNKVDNISSSQYRATRNAGTIDDPIDIGTSYTYNYTSGWENNIANADYTVTITDVDSISRDEIQDLGFQRPDENAVIDYVMVTMKVDVNNATYEGDESIFLDLYDIDLYDVKTTEGNSMISNNIYGFDGCLYDAIEEATKLPNGSTMEVYPNESKSYSATGKILVGVFKNSKNNLSINGGDSYGDKNVYFKLY